MALSSPLHNNESSYLTTSYLRAAAYRLQSLPFRDPLEDYSFQSPIEQFLIHTILVDDPTPSFDSMLDCSFLSMRYYFPIESIAKRSEKVTLLLNTHARTIAYLSSLI